MNEVTLQIGGRNYTISCEEGQEDQIIRLGAVIEEKLSGLGELAPNHSQNLLFAALFLADELQETRGKAAKLASALEQSSHSREEQAHISAQIKQLEAQANTLTSERDALASQYEVAHSKLGEIQNQNTDLKAHISALEQQIKEHKAAAEQVDIAPKLVDLALVIENCASELEERAAKA